MVRLGNARVHREHVEVPKGRFSRGDFVADYRCKVPVRADASRVTTIIDVKIVIRHHWQKQALTGKRDQAFGR